MFTIYKTIIATLLLLTFSSILYAQSINDLLRQPNDPVVGNPKGNVTIVEFFDYQCSYCARMEPIIEAIVRANPNVRVVYKEYPIRGPMSELGSRAALAANKQHKYYPFSHALLMRGPQPLTKDLIFKIAKRVGLDIDQLKKDLNDQNIKKQLKSNFIVAQQFGLTGTPSFLISKTSAQDSYKLNYLVGATNQSQLQYAVNRANR